MTTATPMPTSMAAWPPISTHVRLDEPWTDHLGDEHTDLVVVQQGQEYGGDQHCCWVYDCVATYAPDVDGNPTDQVLEVVPTPGMMMALRRFDYGTVQAVLSQMGFEVAQ